MPYLEIRPSSSVTTVVNTLINILDAIFLFAQWLVLCIYLLPTWIGEQVLDLSTCGPWSRYGIYVSLGKVQGFVSIRLTPVKRGLTNEIKTRRGYKLSDTPDELTPLTKVFDGDDGHAQYMIAHHVSPWIKRGEGRFVQFLKIYKSHLQVHLMSQILISRLRCLMLYINTVLIYCLNGMIHSRTAQSLFNESTWFS